MKHRNIRGTMLYTSKKPERMDERRGIEHFHFTHHADGKTSLRALCEIEEPSPTVLRDITYSLDENGSPMDCFVRISLDDEFCGSGWFNFTPDYVECETFSPELGRVSQRKPIHKPLDGFGTHPVVADGYLMKKMDRSKGPHKRQVHVYLPSPDHRGATPPLIAEVNIWAEYVGEEEVTVPAGTFECHHFRFIDDGTSGMDGKHPAYNVWVTADDDFVMVKGHCDAPMLTHYELISLERE